MTVERAESPARASRVRLTAIGLLSGVLAGLFGLGGGVLVVPALAAWCHRDQRQAAATSLMALGPLVLAGLAGYTLAREVDVWVAVPLAAGSMIGAWLGAKVLDRAPLALLRWFFVGMVWVTGLWLVIAPGVSAGGVPGHEWWRLAILLPVGVLIGLISGVAGIGGGAVMVPLLVLWLALPQHRAHATSLAAIILTAASGVAKFATDDAVSYTGGLGIAAGAIAGAFFGSALMHRMSPTRLRQAFAVLMVLVAVQMLVGYTPEGGAVALEGPALVVGYVLLGLAAGALSALLGVGGGVIMVPAMVVLFGFDQHLAEGTSLLVIIPTAVVGSIRHTRNHYTDWRLGLILGVGGIAGAWLGATVALELDADLLQRLFAAFLLVMAVHLLWTTRRREPDHPVADVT